MTDQILDPFHRQLSAQLRQRMEERMSALAFGSAKRTVDGTETVGELYAAAVAYMQGLTDALNVAAEIERTMLSDGTRPAKVQYD